MRTGVAVVTDSTAALPPGEAERLGVQVIPLDVVVDGRRHVEGVDLVPRDLLAALARGARVSTSQPSPAAFAAAYRRAAAAGAREVVSVHLSGELSGTVAAARLAAGSAPVRVHVVDSGTVGMALGFAVAAGARAAAPPAAVRRRWPWSPAAPEPLDGAAVAARVRAVASTTRVWFLVDSLEHLRRGGRLSTAAAAMGTVLGLRPLLTVDDGRIVVAEKVRTRRAARERLEALAAADVAGRPQGARVAVHHLEQPDVAGDIVAHLGAAPGVVEAVACDAGAVLGAHVGPGVLAVVVADA